MVAPASCPKPAAEIRALRRSPGGAIWNKFGGFRRFGCVQLRFTRKFIERRDAFRSSQGEQTGWPSLPVTWCHHGMGSLQPAPRRSCPGCIQQVPGDQGGLGNIRSSLIYLFFFKLLGGLTSVGDFLLRDVNE